MERHSEEAARILFSEMLLKLATERNDWKHSHAEMGLKLERELKEFGKVMAKKNDEVEELRQKVSWFAGENARLTGDLKIAKEQLHNYIRDNSTIDVLRKLQMHFEDSKTECFNLIRIAGEDYAYKFALKTRAKAWENAETHVRGLIHDLGGNLF